MTLCMGESIMTRVFINKSMIEYRREMTEIVREAVKIKYITHSAAHALCLRNTLPRFLTYKLLSSFLNWMSVSNVLRASSRMVS